MRLNPKFARVILKRTVKEVSKGGIILTDAKKHAENIGVVIAVGPTADESIKLGDTVMFGKMAGAWLKLPNTIDEFYIVQDEDILATVEED